MNEKYNGFFRAKVVNNNDPDKFGRILIWSPDLMPDVPQDQGIWALPANNPTGGRNSENSEDCYYSGSSYIPPKGSWVWVFFEKNNPNRPYYFGALDLQNAKVLPENQLGNEPYNKWVILKTHQGRTIVLSDDSDDARVEITGKKRKISSPPSGSTNSVYEIDANQTTILLDERSGKEKILIRTHKGDFLHIDVDEQKLQGYFKNGIELKSDGDINITGKNINLKSSENLNIYGDDVNVKSNSDVNIDSGDDINISAGNKLNQDSTTDINLKSNGSIKEQANTMISLKSSLTVAIDGTQISENGGISVPAESANSASSASEANPSGNRDD